MTILTREQVLQIIESARVKGEIPRFFGADLIEIELRQAPPGGIDLTQAELHQRRLNRVELIRVDLGGVDLHGAGLAGADLSQANLSQANLSEADLFMANLSEANLSGANFSGAKLFKANLSQANLFRTDLSQANLSMANLSLANLNGMITNDKFCLSRHGQLQLSWSRIGLYERRRTQPAKVDYPSRKVIHSGGSCETTMAPSSPDQSETRRSATLGPGLSTATAVEPGAASEQSAAVQHHPKSNSGDN